ncbi:MAG TPA: hypothetical protein VNX28_18990, partial [Gemmataceae bacterium]|nr:hypothetical protein [Gemmataceae bacterium]
MNNEPNITPNTPVVPEHSGTMPNVTPDASPAVRDQDNLKDATREAQPPRFFATRIESKEDCTFFIHSSDPRTADHASPEEGECYASWSNYLRLAEATQKAGPRHSTAQEVTFRHKGSGDGLFTARGLVCFAARREYVSVTARSIEPLPPSNDKIKPDVYSIRADCTESPFQANPDRTDGTRDTWFSIKEICSVLGGCIFRGMAARNGNWGNGAKA